MQVFAVKPHFQQYFSYIVAVSFIGGGKRCTRRKPPTLNKNSFGDVIAKNRLLIDNSVAMSALC